jgi:hypothetical protein
MRDLQPYGWCVKEIASMYNFTNRMSLACGMIPTRSTMHWRSSRQMEEELA